MFQFDILQSEGINIVEKGQKLLVSVSNQESLSSWVKQDQKKPTGNYLPVFSSPFKTKNKVKPFGNSLGYCYFSANRVEYNQQFVSLLTTPFSVSRGFYITDDNFMKTLVAYSARVLIDNDIWNANDEYRKPSIESTEFEQFTYDSIIVSLFSNNSAQSSYRNFEHIGQTYNIKNEFFWMSAERMKKMGDENCYDELHNDARTASDRYVYKLLFGEQRIYDKLSDDAKSVLDKAIELVEESIEWRKEIADNENHLDSWDAGYAQLKLVWKKCFPEEFKEFRQLYKNMEDRMRPLVYELGFLMK